MHFTSPRNLVFTGIYALFILTSLSAPHSEDWGQLATISSSMGVQAGKLCLGEATRGDIGCPAYAPSVATNGTLTATSFEGNGSKLTNLPQGTTTLTGNVTGSGTGTIATTLANNAVTTVKIADNNVTTAKLPDSAVTLPKIQNIGSNTLLGRVTAGTGNVEQISVGAGLTLTGTTLSANNSGVSKYESGWFLVTTNQTHTVSHGLGGMPDIVQIWYSANATGTGKVQLVSSGTNYGGFFAHITDVTSSNITIHTGSQYVTYYRVPSYQAPTSGYLKVTAIKF